MSPPHYVEVDGTPIIARGNPLDYMNYINEQENLVLLEDTDKHLICTNTKIPEDNNGIFWLETLGPSRSKHVNNDCRLIYIPISVIRNKQ